MQSDQQCLSRLVRVILTMIGKWSYNCFFASETHNISVGTS